MADSKLTTDLLLVNMPNFVIWLNNDGIILGCNDNITELLNINNKHIIGVNFSDFLKKFNLNKAQIDALTSLNQEAIDKTKVIEHEFWLPTPTLKTKKMFVSCIHKPIISNGNFKGLILELIDNTSLKKLQNKLKREIKKSEQERKTAALHLDRIVAHLPNTVYWVDKNSANLGCNDNLAQLLGFNSRKEIKGLTYDDMAKIRNWPSKQVELWRKDDLKVIESGKSNVNINQLTNSEGKIIYQTTTRVPYKDENDKIIGVIGISTDISDRVEVEKKLRTAKEKAEIANQAKTDFLATISHELRTPLNGILGMADILNRQNLGKEQKIFVGDIISSGKTLLSLINGLLDLSKLEAGELEILESPFDVQVITNEVINQLSNFVSKKGLDISCDISDDVPTSLIGDSQRLSQILTNLINNAIKFTEKGSVSVELKCRDKTKKKAIIEFVVSDTGIGIAKKDLKLIFDRFRQLDSSYNKRHSGTGLGLDIVRQLVELMHGEIKINSTLNKGTTFSVSLPFTLQAHRKRSNKWIENYSNIRTLIIEDDLKIGKRLLGYIKTPNVQLVSSQSAFKALEKATKRNQQFQAVILSSKKLSDDKATLTVLKNAQLHFHNPMILSSENILVKNLAFKKLSNTLPEEKFVTSLCNAWKKYELKQSNDYPVFQDSNPKILLVEDNLINQRVTLEMLKELHCSTDIASNGIEAIEKFKNKNYQLILMDIGLPDMDGYEATFKIRELEEENNRIPIIALTAYASANDKQKCFDSGMDIVVTKPIDRASLKNAISSLLK